MVVVEQPTAAAMDAPLCSAAGGPPCSRADADYFYEAVPLRWWILLIFSLLSQLQACTWNFYGPISQQVVDTEHWTFNQIAWVANAANIAMLANIPASALFVRRQGMRLPTLLCAFQMVLCTVLRLVRSDENHNLNFVVAIASMLCNGAAAAWLNFAGPVLSMTWFPMSERGLATAIVCVSPYIGQSEGFIVGPLVVSHTRNEASDIGKLIIGEAICACAVFFAILLRFPSAPDVMPSRTALTDVYVEASAATQQRELARTRIWCRLASVVVLTMVPLGVYSGWVAVLAPNLSGFGVGETEASWIGCVMTLVGALGGIVFGWISDRFPGKLKEMILLCLCASGGSFAWFALVANKTLGGGALALCLSSAAGGFFVNALCPLGFEFAMETAYSSVSEPIAASGLAFLNTAVQVIFLAGSFTSPGGSSGPDSSAWMNWLNVGASLIFVPPLIFFRARYSRLDAEGLAHEPAVVAPA